KPVDALRARGVAIVDGCTFYFCSTAHRDEFKKDPSKFNGQGVTVPIFGMTCEKCVARIDAAIRQIAGLACVNVDLEPKSARTSPLVSFHLIATGVKSGGDGRYSIDERAPAEEATGERLQAKGRTVAVKGMTCASCVARVEHAIARVPGVTGVVVNLATESAQIEGGSDTEIAGAVRAAGYDIGRRAPETGVVAATAIAMTAALVLLA